MFRSPAVHTPQEGRELVTAYLAGAIQVLGPTLTYHDEWVRELASRIEHAQAGEINEYRQTARDLGLDIDIPGADVPPTNLPDRED